MDSSSVNKISSLLSLVDDMSFSVINSSMIDNNSLMIDMSDDDESFVVELLSMIVLSLIMIML